MERIEKKALLSFPGTIPPNQTFSKIFSKSISFLSKSRPEVQPLVSVSPDIQKISTVLTVIGFDMINDLKKIMRNLMKKNERRSLQKFATKIRRIPKTYDDFFNHKKSTPLYDR